MSAPTTAPDDNGEVVTITGLPLTPDFAAWPVTHRIDRAASESRALRIEWNDGRLSRFHFRWLRDACPCAECLNPITREQIFDISTVAPDVSAVAADVDVTGALAITWSDGNHRSRFHPGWLRAHDYSNHAPLAARSRAVTTWGAEFVGRIPSFDGIGVLEDERGLYKWLLALREFGLTRLCGVPTDERAIERVAARIGVIRETNFGRTFDVCAKTSPDSNAYTAVALPLHTDLPTREVQPGIQMLHCLVNEASGGESVMVDSFRLAEVLERDHPSAFEVLARVPLDYTNRAKQTDYRWRAPMIALDESGHVTELRPGANLRAPVTAPFDEMDTVYDGIQTFFRLTRDDALRAVFPIHEGDLLAFDNRRVLHARTAYDTSGGERRLKGCYLDRDELPSRIRVLERG